MFLFLDIDGVLNCKEDWNRGPVVRESCVASLAGLLEQHPMKIILTSSWRRGFISRNNPKNSPQIRMLEEKLGKKGLEIKGTLIYSDTDRGKAIRDFVKKYPEEYLILDDDTNEYKVLPKNLYLTDYRTGLNEKDVKKICRMLKGKYWGNK